MTQKGPSPRMNMSSLQVLYMTSIINSLKVYDTQAHGSAVTEVWIVDVHAWTSTIRTSGSLSVGLQNGSAQQFDHKSLRRNLASNYSLLWVGLWGTRFWAESAGGQERGRGGKTEGSGMRRCSGSKVKGTVGEGKEQRWPESASTSLLRPSSLEVCWAVFRLTVPQDMINTRTMTSALSFLREPHVLPIDDEVPFNNSK